MKEEIAIWGTGTAAKKFYYLYKNNFQIKCFYDNDKRKQNTYLYGIPIKKWKEAKENYKIIIASSYWQEILNSMGGGKVYSMERCTII